MPTASASVAKLRRRSSRLRLPFFILIINPINSVNEHSLSTSFVPGCFREEPEMNKIRSSRTQRILGEDSPKTSFCPSFLRFLEHLRPGRKPMAYPNLVTEMSLIKLFIYKGQGKARGNQQGWVQYFGFTTHRSELSRSLSVEGGKGRKFAWLLSPPTHPLISCYCLPLESIMQGSPLLQSLRIGLPGHRAGAGGQREGYMPAAGNLAWPWERHDLPCFHPGNSLLRAWVVISRNESPRGVQGTKCYCWNTPSISEALLKFSPSPQSSW